MDESDLELLAAYRVHVDPAGTLEQAQAAADLTCHPETYAERVLGASSASAVAWLERHGTVFAQRGPREWWVFSPH
jgi:hypothetical protein